MQELQSSHRLLSQQTVAVSKTLRDFYETKDFQ